MNLNKTKIVATIGPASSSRSMLSKLISSGVDVFRVNFSHATHKEVKRIVSDIKSLRVEKTDSDLFGTTKMTQILEDYK